MKEKEFLSSLKSLDTEENIDIHFYRRLGWMWANMARKLGITPNAITIASIFIGVAAGVCFYSTNIWVNIGGLLLLILANSFDSADGQLARMTKQYSRLGRILDGLAGDMWFVSIYVSVCLRTVNTTALFAGNAWAIWSMAVVAGVCHIIQAALADYYRQMHLQCVNGKSELDNSASLREKLAESKGMSRVMMRLYLFYTLCQERIIPNAVALQRRGTLPEEFRRESLPLMKYANALTFNWRSITLAVTLLCGNPWLYFVAEITLGNILLVYMVGRHERICRRLLSA